MIALDPCLPAAVFREVRAAIEAFAPFRTYVSQPQADGVGRGLVRRHDAAMNHLSANLRAGISEPLDVFAARSNLFRGVLAEGDAVHLPAAAPLWRNPAFIDGAHAVSGRPVVEPSMLYVNVLVPGQELPTHTDTPAFVGLDQTCCPEWLLVVMGHSGLFAEWRVPMVGAVAFFGDCSPGGDLVVFDDGRDAEPVLVPARDNTAVVFDSEEAFHGVNRVGGSDAPPPPSEVGMWIERAEGDVWRVGGSMAEVARYPRSALRMSVQWKAKCRHAAGDAPEPLTRADAEARLVADLRARDVVGEALPDETQLALRMIETYVRFPDHPLNG